MFSRLLLIFVLLPLADLVLIWMLLKIHIGITVLWILLSGVIGAWYVRRQGTSVLAEIRRSVGENRIPTDILVEGGIVIFAGGLLITPGLITDLFGFSMLIAPCRRWYRRRFLAWLKKKVEVRTFTMSSGPGGPMYDSDVIDATVTGRKSTSTPDGPSATPPPVTDPLWKSSEYRQ